MDFTIYMEKKLKEARKKNLLELREKINSTDIKNKINNYIERWDGEFSEEEIKNGILTNDLIASFFTVNPKRQNICEKEAIEILGKAVKKLPSQKENCIRFNSNGEIVWKKNNDTSESADCFYNNEYYTTLKYTDEEGGAQNNQYEKVNIFLKYGSIGGHKVAAILDGAYWDKHREKLIEEYKNNPNVLITSVTEITENFQ